MLDADAAWSATFVVVSLLLLGSQRCGQGLPQFVEGQQAPYDIQATYAIEIDDPELSDERRRQAREDVPQVYTYDTDRRLRLAREMTALFEGGRRLLEEAKLQGHADPAVFAVENLAERFPRDVVLALVDQRFDVALESELTAALSHAMRGPVVDNKALIEREPAILMLHLPGRRVNRVSEYASISDIDTAREDLRRQVRERLHLTAAREQAFVGLTQSFLAANLHLDYEATERRRETAAAAVPPVRIRVARGELLIDKGRRLTSEDIELLQRAGQGIDGLIGVREALALLLVVCMLAFFLYRYSAYHQRSFHKIRHLHALLVLMLLSALLLAQGILWLAGRLVGDLFSPFDQLGSYSYLIPVAAGAILIALLTNGRIATVYSGFAAVLFGALTGWDFHMMLWAVLVQLSGVYAISTYGERTALLRAGLVVGSAGTVSALAIESLRGQLEPLSHSLFVATLAFVGGAVGVGLVVSFCLPLLENLFNVLTDVRLLELSNVNTPLLSRLAVKAPGSYNHSLIVGTLAEEAAKSIGANSLLCRVAAFYHDIGKVNHAEYFVENQRGVNPHDRLSPSMSALIIASHVKDGVKLAREARLPEQIVAMIPQHHGTKVMTYFYEKAKNSVDPALGPVKEEDFRYPGPKPQTREAAIFMLADAVEAAARTVDEPTPNRLKELIRKITNSIVIDGQLDSCDLTFADLETLQQAFLRLLVSMYHHRVEYPGFGSRRPRVESKPSAELAMRKVARGT
jgi:putative nucleotidyltransferase with HDIG domain